MSNLIFGLYFVENQYDDYNGKKINHLIIGQNMWSFALLYWVLRNKCAFENDMITFWICTLFQTILTFLIKVPCTRYVN